MSLFDKAIWRREELERCQIAVFYRLQQSIPPSRLNAKVCLLAAKSLRSAQKKGTFKLGLLILYHVRAHEISIFGPDEQMHPSKVRQNQTY